MRLENQLHGRAKWIATVIPAVALTFVLMLLAPAAKPASPQSEEAVNQHYLSPIEMALSPDGRFLYVVCQASDEMRVVDLASGTVVSNVPVGHVPRGIALSRDGRRIYVTNAWSDTVSVIDAATLTVVRTLPTGFEPTGIVCDKSGKTLYVANRLSSDISVVDVNTGQEIKRLLAGRGASYLALSADGKWIYARIFIRMPELSERSRIRKSLLSIPSVRP